MDTSCRLLTVAEAENFRAIRLRSLKEHPDAFLDDFETAGSLYRRRSDGKVPMTYQSLRDFIDRLEKTGRLVRVKESVSPNLEMTEIGTRLIAQGGPAVLFENVATHTMPVLINLFGT